MTLSLSEVRLGPQERLLLRWDGDVWHADYQKRLTPPTQAMAGFTEVHYERGSKIGIPGESAEEVARGAIQIAQLQAAHLPTGDPKNG